MKKLTKALARVKIEITANDIRLGKRGQPTSCPIARAIKRELGDHPKVGGSGSFSIMLGGEYQRYSAPDKAGKFVYRFDTDGKDAVKPFSFVARLRR